MKDYIDVEGLKDFLSMAQMNKDKLNYYLVEALAEEDGGMLDIFGNNQIEARYYPWVELKVVYVSDDEGGFNGRLLFAKKDGGYGYLTNLDISNTTDLTNINQIGSFEYELPVDGDKQPKIVRVVWTVEFHAKAHPVELKKISLSKEDDDSALVLSNLVYAGGNSIERLTSYIRYLISIPNPDRNIDKSLHYVWQGKSILVYACLVSNRPYMLLDRIDGVTDNMKKLIQQGSRALSGRCNYVLTMGNEKIPGTISWTVEVNLRNQTTLSQPVMGTAPRPQDPTLIKINEIFNTPCYQPGEEYDAIFSIKSKNGNHSRTTFRARIYNLNGENIKMPMFSLYVNTEYTSTWTNVYTTAWISPVDGDTDGTVTDMGAISIIPIPGEEGRLYRAVYHPHTPTYSHAKIANRTSIPAFDID